MAMTQVGMILFNYGLTFGFASLGDMTGSTLPASFIAVPSEAGSPLYPYAAGVAITMATIFGLGLLATRAEPALGVLGETVEALSGGRMTKRMLIWAVAAGVAAGMCAGGSGFWGLGIWGVGPLPGAVCSKTFCPSQPSMQNEPAEPGLRTPLPLNNPGACKILFRLPLIYFILAKYLVACALTVVSRESVTAVAWDSAGGAFGGWGGGRGVSGARAGGPAGGVRALGFREG
jgi:hypothetical protein